LDLSISKLSEWHHSVMSLSNDPHNTNPFGQVTPGLSSRNHGRYLRKSCPTGRPWSVWFNVHGTQCDVVSNTATATSSKQSKTEKWTD